VFRNLPENAAAPHAPSRCACVWRPRGGPARREIADRGIGIPRRARKIFRRFYRTGREVQRQVAGLGLGLFIVRQLVRRQGGEVVARSEGQGRGSRFVVRLRAAPAAIRPRAERAAAGLRADA
jgi:K+-sensing histidine kinase KdpD